MRRRAYAHAVKNLHQGAGLFAHHVPWPQCRQNKHCADIENKYAINNLVYGAGNCAVGVVRLRRRNADKFDAAKGKHYNSQTCYHSPNSVGEKTAMLPKIAYVVGKRPIKNKINSQYYHAANCRNFHRRKYKLGFPVGTDGGEVKCGDYHYANQRA